MINGKSQAIRDRENAGRALCTQCRLEKPLTEFNFYLRVGVKRPHCRCRACEKARVDALRPTGYFKSKEARHVARRKEKYPEKAAAAWIVASALKNGTLVRPADCEDCGAIPALLINGASGIQGHHEDYARPLDVNWVCQRCHIERHRTSAPKQPE